MLLVTSKILNREGKNKTSKQPRLVTLLSDYNPQEDWYLGKRSIKTPLKILNREGKNKTSKQQFVKFWFGTGGAGYCISRALALKMLPIASGGKFISICEKIRLPDDCTMGYIIEHRLQRPMTVIEEFHSHLEPMKFLHQDKFSQQVTFSYMQYAKDVVNRLNIESFDTSVDPTRFLSLHCLLFPYFTYCPK
ncbi:fringe glycosyltransferase [Diaphorina citri]|uniref:Fringe glycosyltransferase n=1 Tax=Diaphorina citri TaxID=121845 RepID=A0A1S3CUN6_DIACI|nr:fringe glycosyltransferase [Diaphorina citri]